MRLTILIILLLLSVGLLLAETVYADVRTYELRRALVYECDQECVWVDSRDSASRYSDGYLSIDLDDMNQPSWLSYYVEVDYGGELYIYTLAQRIVGGNVRNLLLENGWRVLFMYWSPDERMAFFVDDGTGQTLYLNFWPPERFQ